jgi:hypothetical protein
MRPLRSLSLVVLVWGAAYAQSLPSGQPSTAQALAQPDLALLSSIYVKVRIAKTVKISALKPGDVVEGKLAQDVYSGDRELFPAESPVRLMVDKLGRRKRVPNDYWPWVIKVFTPRHENYPTFQSATVSLPDGKEVPLRVSLIFINRQTEVLAQAKTKKAAHPTASSVAEPPAARAAQGAPESAGTRDKGPFVTLEATNPSDALTTSRETSLAVASSDPVTLASGTLAKIILLGGVSASKSRAGDSFQARLVEPVRLDSKIVLPEGTLLGGKIAKSTPPRMLSRSGSLLLTFTDLTLPGRTSIPATASVTAAELDQRSHTKIDPEGKLHGDRPGKAWMAINLGVTAGIAKEADDATQLLVEALVSSATDASTAGTARIVGICASSVFLLTRHGRDVVLPRFTEMNISFDRPVSVPGTPVVAPTP